MTATVLAVTLLMGCRGGPGSEALSCSTDQDCVQGRACRDGRCARTCPGRTWIGQEVVVEGTTGPRPGIVVACDKKIWIRYASGIEEQIGPERLRRETKGQAR